MRIENPYHEGERSVQERAGEAEAGRRNGRVIADEIPAGAIEFIAQQSMAILGSVSPDGSVWSSVLTGLPGFVTALNPREMEFDLARADSHPRDPLWRNLQDAANVGMLVIELASRRRLRVNGRMRRRGGNRLRLDVSEAYPNCPKYIQRRHVSLVSENARVVPEATEGREPTFSQRQWIAGSDTFFVASVHPERGPDASHRGGQPGFVEFLDQRTLRVPDYSGNSMFNTMGNFAVDSRAGLVFPDFEKGRVLQTTGRVEIRWDRDDPAARTGGTRRFWDFHVERTLEAGLSRPFRAEFLDAWPRNP